MRLIATSEPRYHPRNTSALPPRLHMCSSTHSNSVVMAYEDGNSLCLQHIFRSAAENVSRWEVHRPEPSRECLFALVSYRRRRRLHITHSFQIVDDCLGGSICAGAKNAGLITEW